MVYDYLRVETNRGSICGFLQKKKKTFPLSRCWLIYFDLGICSRILRIWFCVFLALNGDFQYCKRMDCKCNFNSFHVSFRFGSPCPHPTASKGQPVLGNFGNCPFMAANGACAYPPPPANGMYAAGPPPGYSYPAPPPPGTDTPHPNPPEPVFVIYVKAKILLLLLLYLLLLITFVTFHPHK